MGDGPDTDAQATRFRMGPLLGGGAFGSVYLARMRSPGGIEKAVAVKVLRASVSPRAEPVGRMRDEGRMLAALDHPVILSVNELTSLAGKVALVTEYVAGLDLDACIDADPPLPMRAAAEVAADVADALDSAWRTPGPHGRPLGLVHRDVKPANIRITPHGSVKLLDFGIAKADELERSVRPTRGLFGTPEYMAPEVLTCEVTAALPSRDVFALGSTLYEAVAGRLLFDGMDVHGVVRLAHDADAYEAHVAEAVELVADRSAALAALLGRMLAFDHEARPSPRDLVEALHALDEGLPGARLRAWCRARAWEPPGGRTGELSGRTLVSEPLRGDTAGGSDATFESDGAPETLMPPLAAEPAGPPEPTPPPPVEARRRGSLVRLLGLAVFLGAAGLALGAGVWALGESGAPEPAPVATEDVPEAPVEVAVSPPEAPDEVEVGSADAPPSEPPSERSEAPARAATVATPVPDPVPVVPDSPAPPGRVRLLGAEGVRVWVSDADGGRRPVSGDGAVDVVAGRVRVGASFSDGDPGSVQFEATVAEGAELVVKCSALDWSCWEAR